MYARTHARARTRAHARARTRAHARTHVLIFIFLVGSTKLICVEQTTRILLAPAWPVAIVTRATVTGWSKAETDQHLYPTLGMSGAQTGLSYRVDLINNACSEISCGFVIKHTFWQIILQNLIINYSETYFYISLAFGHAPYILAPDTRCERHCILGNDPGNVTAK
jgi:hypothetical protein